MTEQVALGSQALEKDQSQISGQVGYGYNSNSMENQAFGLDTLGDEIKPDESRCNQNCALGWNQNAAIGWNQNSAIGRNRI